jgi:endonuclease YncB( thermonuclease family)
MPLVRVTAIVLVVFAPVMAFGHEGGLDNLGCHHNGEPGGYHCHQGPLAGYLFGSEEEAVRALGPPPEAAQATPAPARAPTPPNVIFGAAFPVSGDTFRIIPGEDDFIGNHGKSGLFIRLFGIDAPEFMDNPPASPPEGYRQQCKAEGQKYPCGLEAFRALGKKILPKLGKKIGAGAARRRTFRNTVTCDLKGAGTDRVLRDRDPRNKPIVAVCWIGTEDLAEWMVLEGWALAYREHSTDYVWAEEAAKAAGKGLWAGEFEAPWEWRARVERKRERLEALEPLIMMIASLGWFALLYGIYPLVQILVLIRWKGGWRLIAAVPLVIILGVFFIFIFPDLLVDPTSHNLWFMELGPFAFFSLIFLGLAALFRAKRRRDTPPLKRPG